ncbi:PilZ domain-containing protein [Salinivibrio sharmensis]|uniref:PilZ domain-containing protein n=1 Tax=Salinivibrio sharmensis TaxID=390883 RepID=A0ABX3KJ30_9GAMM|nr:PilZ domain-containing protein [Salinivibrio sharmensis]OOE89332.1 hypothetical protein BZG74_05695 [Salinivibrio sharmensis]
MPRKEQLNAIEKTREAISLPVATAVLKLGGATLVRVHIQTPTNALFRFNALLIGSDGQRFCYVQLPQLSSQQRRLYFGAGYNLRIHGVSPEGALMRFGGRIHSVMEGYHTLLSVELTREGATATPLRQDRRFPVELAAQLNMDGKSAISVTIHDLSVGGCLFSYRAVGLQINAEQLATLSLVDIAASQALTMTGMILSHRLKGDRYHCGFKFDDRSKSRGAWLITNLDYDGEQYHLSVPNNDGELTSSLS